MQELIQLVEQKQYQALRGRLNEMNAVDIAGLLETLSGG